MLSKSLCDIEIILRKKYLNKSKITRMFYYQQMKDFRVESIIIFLLFLSVGNRCCDTVYTNCYKRGESIYEILLSAHVLKFFFFKSLGKKWYTTFSIVYLYIRLVVRKIWKKLYI